MVACQKFKTWFYSLTKLQKSAIILFLLSTHFRVVARRNKVKTVKFSFFSFVFVSCLMGCGAATVSGRIPAEEVDIVDASPVETGSPDVGSVVDAPSVETTPTISATLRVTITSEEVLRQTVRNATVLAMRVGFTSSVVSNNLVTALTLTGVGNVASGLRRSDLRRVIVRCELRDGSVLLGTSRSPDDAGRMSFTGFWFLVAAGTSRALNVSCLTDSVVAQTYDEFAVGIDSENDVVWQPSDARFGRTTYLDAALQNQTGRGDAVPPVVIRVYPSGTMTIMPNNLRAATILVPNDAWQNLAQYRVLATREDQTLDVIRVTSRGDAASFSMVALATDGAVAAWGILPAGHDQSINLYLSTPLAFRAGEPRLVQVWVRLANVVSHAAAPGTEGVARSGAMVAAGFASSDQTGEWDANYRLQWNARVSGQISGSRIYATATDPRISDDFMVRRSVPTITSRPIASNRLVVDSETELYAWQVSADVAGAIAWRKEIFDVQVERVSGSELRLEEFGLFRNGMPVYPMDCQILGLENLNLRGRLSRASPDRFPVVVRFIHDEVIVGAGAVYSLRAMTRSAMGGDVVRITPLGSSIAPAGEPLVTGRLSPSDVVGMSGPHLNISAMGLPSIVATAFLWSDISEIPHDNTSADWTNATFIHDRTVTRTLTVP